MPTFDEIQLEVAKRVGDPVAAVATAGSRFSSAQRVFAINEAIRRFIIKAVRAKLEGALQNYIVTASQALVASVKPLSGFTGGVMGDAILSAYNVTDSVVVRELPARLEAQTRTGGNSYLTASATNQSYVIDTANFKLLDGASSTDVILLRYVSQHTDLANGGTILVPSEYHPQIIDLAVSVIKEMDASSEAFAQSQIKEEKVTRELG